LILRRIIKIVATRCHVLRLKCTKFDFVWGSVTDPIGGAEGAYLILRGVMGGKRVSYRKGGVRFPIKISWICH